MVAGTFLQAVAGPDPALAWGPGAAGSCVGVGERGCQLEGWVGRWSAGKEAGLEPHSPELSDVWRDGRGRPWPPSRPLYLEGPTHLGGILPFFKKIFFGFG